ncbi:MAG: malonyl-CoA decarboxylase [Acidobacteria bacterium]|nr:malonyl-CoA decarboxylase [Acidobacteriota bacterium]
MPKRRNPAAVIESLVRMAGKIVDSTEAPEELLEEARVLYDQLPVEAEAELFRRLLDTMEVPAAEIGPVLDEAREALASDTPIRAEALATLRKRLTSRLHLLLEKMADSPGGLRLLIGLRSDILSAQRRGASGLEPFESEIADLLTAWFRHGFLSLEEITPRSPYQLIRYLKDRELVHPMVSLEEMGLRLGADRRCFGLFHCAMPDVPVVFIEVALTGGIPRSIDEIIGPAAKLPEEHPDTAVFYSINNTQNGLAGLGLGKVLVYRVTEILRRDNPDVKTYVTLSPIPGLWPRYLRPILEGRATNFGLTRTQIEEEFPAKSRELIVARAAARLGRTPASLADALLALLSSSEWFGDPALVRALRKPLTEIAYIHVAKERDARGRPLNPVANFHLSNGAIIPRRMVHFGANTTRRGLEDSCSLMASYVYSQRWFQALRRNLGL